MSGRFRRIPLNFYYDDTKNEIQKERLETAFELLESRSLESLSNATVIVGDPVDADYALTGPGRGTLKMGNNKFVATVCGVVERVNNTAYVRSLRARYKSEDFDIIVGRIIEVGPKRWRLEINSSQDATLLVSSVSLPGAIQIRRTAVDELNMRSIFVENDVICAEVCGFEDDGTVHLQVGSQKYCKLERGQLLTVPPYLVKKRRQHFLHLDQYGVDLILGSNGFIWIGEHVDVKDDRAVDQVRKDDEEQTYTTEETRKYICRIANAIRVFSALSIMVTKEAVMETVNLSLSLNHGVDEMLGVEFLVLVAEKEAERRSTLRKGRQ